MTPITIQGRRRPNCEVVRSLITPMIGPTKRCAKEATPMMSPYVVVLFTGSTWATRNDSEVAIGVIRAIYPPNWARVYRVIIFLLQGRTSSEATGGTGCSLPITESV